MKTIKKKKVNLVRHSECCIRFLPKSGDKVADLQLVMDIIQPNKPWPLAGIYPYYWLNENREWMGGYNNGLRSVIPLKKFFKKAKLLNV